MMDQNRDRPLVPDSIIEPAEPTIYLCIFCWLEKQPSIYSFILFYC